MKMFSRVLIVCLCLGFGGLVVSDEGGSHFKDLELFNKVLHIVKTQYYREVDTRKLIEGAINGMMETLDPHSSYLPKKMFDKMQVDTKGEFGGLGLEVTQKDGIIYVITPIDDTPAYRAGLQPGDKIVEINHESTIGYNLDEAVDKMRGKANSAITIGVSREGYEGIKRFDMKREVIKVKPIKSRLVQDSYAYIRLTQFQKSSGSHITKALKNMKKKIKKPLKGIILDLRYNPGGLLDEAVEVSSIFLKEGIVVTAEYRDPQQKDIRYVDKSAWKDTETPMVVLINGASASASEIVSGALQDHGRAIIMGALSFGKGLVQTVAPIDKDNGVKLTIAQFFTPKGNKIQTIGIKPDISLPEIPYKVIEENMIEESFIREKDLKGHLSATVESDVEKKARKKKDRDERLARIKKMKLKKSKKNEDEKDFLRKYDPNTDYQVIQAINHLKSFKVFKTMKNDA